MDHTPEKWKLTEEVVEHLERVLSPNSTIERNVFLPDLINPDSDRRQCDVIIKSGNEPRQTVTLVEIQDRQTPVEINTFHGWCEKMRRIGAQHLICVSRQEYPKSIIEDARQRGPTVRLMTLKEVQQGKWPMGIFGDGIFTYYVDKIKHVKIIREQVKQGYRFISLKNIPISDKIFEYGRKTVSIKDLFDAYIDEQEDKIEGPLESGTGSVSFELPQKGNHLWYNDGKRRFEIQCLQLEITFETKEELYPVKITSYEQYDQTSPLAWIMETNYTIEGRDVPMKVIWVPEGERGWKITIPPTPNLLPGTRLKIYGRNIASLPSKKSHQETIQTKDQA